MAATPPGEGEPSTHEHQEQAMPHVIVKLWPGKSEQQKTRLAEAITKSVMDIRHYGEESVAMEEIKSPDGLESVYQPDIQSQWAKIYKKPGYDVNDLWVGQECDIRRNGTRNKRELELGC